MSQDIPTTMPEAGPFLHSWTDRRLLIVNHQAFATAVDLPRSVQEHQQRREELRRRLRFVSGLDSIEFLPFKEKLKNRRVYENVAIHDIDIDVIPGLRLTGNVFMPEKLSAPAPAILCPHGHWTNGRVHHDERGGVIMRCMQLAKLGFVVLAHDMIGKNDNNDLPHTFSKEFKYRADAAGISPFALQLLNSIRAIDLLVSLDEVDPERIGCTGASGGASQTWFVAILDERIKAAAPVCMLSSHFQGGCGCEEGSLLRLHGLTNFEIVAALAPMPLMIPSVTRDWTNLNPDYEIPHLRKVYDLYGAGDKLYNFHCDAPHNYNRNSREHVYSFFMRELMAADCGETVPEAELQVPPPEMLWHNKVKPEAADDRKSNAALDKLIAAYTLKNSGISGLRNILSTVDCNVKDVVERVAMPLWKIGSSIAHMRVISRRNEGDFIFGVKVTPEKITQDDKVILFLSPESYREYFDDGKFAVLTQSAIDNGVVSMAGELLGSGETAPQMAYSPRNDDDPQQLTFNPSYFSMRVQDIITMVQLLKERSGNKRVITVAPGITALPAMAAAALTGCELIADTSELSENIWDDKLNYQPHILKIGGTAGLRELCAATTAFGSGIMKINEILQKKLN